MKATMERMVLMRQDLRERFEERAAIYEYEAHLPREDAERLAMQGLVAEFMAKQEAK